MASLQLTGGSMALVFRLAPSEPPVRGCLIKGEKRNVSFESVSRARELTPHLLKPAVATGCKEQRGNRVSLHGAAQGVTWLIQAYAAAGRRSKPKKGACSATDQAKLQSKPKTSASCQQET